ncbi:hypothetical protein BGZ97_007763 [Linnemannia gamsii]|uniref:Uncharacterized protein n=1 Tax=Linnemannia gamsii TaxID=64522 RepID=A0A9P6RCP6_9FUNG|nr:hypothetical protein BGZ97_007763 [Linnemannia gamsii]
MQFKTLTLAFGAIVFLAMNAVAKIPVSTDITAAKNSVWVRWLPNALPAAGYITLQNSSDQDLDVTKIKSPDYQAISIYQTVADSESSKMVKLEKFTIPANGEFAFVPALPTLESLVSYFF